MKMAVEKFNGETINYICENNVKSGDVIAMGGLIGIAVQNGSIGESISVNISKVWSIKAKDSEAIKVGDTLYWDDSAKELTKTKSSNTQAGKAVSSKGATAGNIDIKINI